MAIYLRSSFELSKVLKDNLTIHLSHNKITKRLVAKELGVSYPTILSKLNSPGTFTVSELGSLCYILKIDINDLLNKNY